MIELNFFITLGPIIFKEPQIMDQNLNTSDLHKITFDEIFGGFLPMTNVSGGKYQYVPAPWLVRSIPAEMDSSVCFSIILLRPKSVILISIGAMIEFSLLSSHESPAKLFWLRFKPPLLAPWPLPANWNRDSASPKLNWAPLELEFVEFWFWLLGCSGKDEFEATSRIFAGFRS